MSLMVVSLACVGFFWVQRACPHTGGQDKTSLSARPSALVSQGGHVTLRCYYRDGLNNFTNFTLYKDDRSHVPIFPGRIFQESFLMGPVTPAHAGTYRCRGSYPHSPTEWSALSEPLAIRVTGVHRKPSLLALPGPLVKSGEMITLQCSSDIVFGHFFLHSEVTFEELLHLVGELHGGGSQANYSINSMTSDLAGTYRCYGSVTHSPYVLSAPSDTLDIVITGLYEKPSLSAQPGPTVQAGENVTLSCSSQISFDIYPGRGRLVNLVSLQCQASMEHSRPTSLWALPPTEEPTDASVLSVPHPTSGQTRVTHCPFLSQETFHVVGLHPLNQAPKPVSPDTCLL
uniref:Killer immunoglobulin-like receptor 3DS n=1 Tax=Macaca fascicularis TaxID=9541 RepID=A0A1L5JHL9_MACFA|nr:killer immunoglobulin-like receptor 3DS [Macaca fascicularis]WNI41293.1 killer cell immunoglobulin-like receptor 3DSW13*002Q [Macaca fascicularis]WOC22962.1 killer cell immunoglobulin-like receptor 3DSW13*002Q [Macaca fascicularis]